MIHNIFGSCFSEDYLVQVQAQVMTRDDSTQCWVPMGGGGLSTVKLCKLARGRRSPSTEQKPEYVIHGERLADKSVSKKTRPHCHRMILSFTCTFSEVELS